MAADITQKSNNFVLRTTDGVVSLLDVLDKLDAIYGEYVSLDYGTVITDEVLAGSSSQHLDRQMFVDGIASLEALKTFIQSGHGTNLQRFRR